jgi:hypothetical protein
MLRPWLRNWVRVQSGNGKELGPSDDPRRRKRVAFRPGVEELEKRQTPAVSFAQQTFADAGGPVSVAVADFNGDGKPDLVVANRDAGTVAVLLNTTPAGSGTASFAAGQLFFVGSGPLAVALGDFNGDGRPDLAVANSNDNTVSVLLNTTPVGASTVSFAAQQTFAVGNSPMDLAVGDFNRDGRPDLAVVNGGDNTVSVLRNTTPAGSFTPSFAAQQIFAVGMSPQGVAVGDVNGDGSPDLAVANGNDSTVSVLLNTTAAGASAVSFAAQQTFTIGANSVEPAVALVDLNGDGRLDLAVTNFFGNSVGVLMNTTATGAPAASFAAMQTFATGTYPQFVAAGEFDGDGRPDLAVANYGDKTLSVLLNTTAAGAAASFAPQQTLALSNQPYAVASGDFNGDGQPDLAAVCGGSPVSVLVNTTVLANPQSVAVGQGQAKALTLTGSTQTGGTLKFTVTANPSHGTLSGFNSSTGAITYTPAADYGGSDIFQFTVTDTTTNRTSAFATVSINELPLPSANAQSVSTGQGQSKNFTLTGSAPNGDAFTFAISANPAHGSLSGFNSSTGAVTYLPAASYTGSDSFSFTVTVTATNLTSAPAAVSMNVFSVLPSFTAQQTFAGGVTAPFATAMAWADINGDGKPDLIVVGSNTVSVLLNTTPAGSATATFAAAQTFAAGNEISGVAVGDFAGDGKPDITVTNSSDNTVSILVNTTAAGSGTVTFNAPQTFAVGTLPSAIAAVDLNGDGKPDLVVTNQADTTLSVLLNTSTGGTFSFAAQQTFAVGGGYMSVAAADLNGDGKPDLVLGNPANDLVAVLLNTTPAMSTTVSFAAPQAIAAGDGPENLAVADLNGDNKPDVVIPDSNANVVTVLPNTTAPGATSASFAPPQTFAVGNGPDAVAVADFNGDGQPDLAVANYQSNTVSVLLNTTTAGAASASFAAQQTFAVGTFPNIAVAVDLNGNGLPDLAVVGQGFSVVSVLMNTTPPTADPQVVLAGQGQPRVITLTGSALNNDPLTYAISTSPTHGTVTASDANHQVTYTPAAGYNGPDSFQFQITDTKTGFTSTATVGITVRPPPTANALAVVLGQGQAKALTLSGSAPNGDAYTFAVMVNPAHGTLSGFNSAIGAVTYTPAAGYIGQDSFSFTVTDTASGLTSTAAVIDLTVVPAPTVNGQNLLDDINTARAVTLTSTDPNGDPLTFQVTVNPARGSLSGTAPNLMYTPNSNYTGPDGFSFTVTDTASGLTSTATINLTVVPPPAANGQNLLDDINTARAVTLTSTDPNNDPLAYQVTAPPAHGSLSGTAPNLTYTPNSNYTGADGFSFKVTDTASGLTSTATINLTVVPPPAANGQNLIDGENTAKAVTLTSTDPDNDPLTFQVTVNPAHGSLSGTAPSLTYTPAAGYAGPDGFQFTVTDSTTTLTGAAATVSITVVPPPTANAQSVAAAQNTTRIITLTSTDPNNDPLSFAVTANPSHGTLSGLTAATGQVTYAPAAAYTGPDSFQFTVTDTTTGLVSNTATVSVTVASPPVANPQSATASLDQAKGLALTGSAPGGHGFSFAVTTNPAHGTLTGFNSNTGQVTYTPAAGFLGADSFQFTVTDTTTTLTGTATVNLTVAANAVSFVTGQFGGQGVWQYNLHTGAWTQLTAANASRLASDPFGDVAAVFPGQGIWVYTAAAGWKQLHPLDASLLAIDGKGEVVAEFPGYGVGQFLPGTGWRLLTAANASLLSVDANGDIAAEFPDYGVWEFTASGWKQLNGVDVTLLAMGAAGTIAADFKGYGVGLYADGSWSIINGAQASSLAVDGPGNVAAEFPGYGVGQYLAGVGWRLLTAANSALLAADAGQVFGEFPGYGLWEFDPIRGWFQLTGADALLFAAS